MNKKNSKKVTNITMEESPQRDGINYVKNSPKLCGSKAGLQEADTRATFIVQEDQLSKIKGIAYWERVSIKDVVNKAFELVIDKYKNSLGQEAQISLKTNKSTNNI